MKIITSSSDQYITTKQYIMEQAWADAGVEMNDILNPTWRNIIIDDIITDYMINKIGDVYSVKSNKILATRTNEFGYERVNISVSNSCRTFKVHRLVAQAFIPNPDNKPEVNHIDGIKLHNWVGNLEWVSSSENKKHAWNQGYYENARIKATGINSAINVYPEQLIHQICALMEKGTSCIEISQRLQVPVSLPNSIKYAHKWNSISSKYNIPEYHKRPPGKFRYLNDQIKMLVLSGVVDTYEILNQLNLPDTREYKDYIACRRYAIQNKMIKKQSSTTIDQQ